METSGMKNIKLSPFVYKIKGARYYALFDLDRQKLFKIIPEGIIEDIKNQLLQANLLSREELEGTRS